MQFDDRFSTSEVMASTPPEPGAAHYVCQNRLRPGRRLNSDGLQRVCTFIEQNLHRQLELADLAAKAGISRFHFARVFRLAVGESPMRYLLRMRIDRAKQLLCEPRGFIGDIALDLGFYDQSHFTRSFRRFTGISPSEFARRHFRPCHNCADTRQTWAGGTGTAAAREVRERTVQRD